MFAAVADFDEANDYAVLAAVQPDPAAVRAQGGSVVGPFAGDGRAALSELGDREVPGGLRLVRRTRGGNVPGLQGGEDGVRGLDGFGVRLALGVFGERPVDAGDGGVPVPCACRWG